MNHKLIVLSISLALIAGARNAQDTAIPSFQSNGVARFQQVVRSVASVLQRASAGFEAITAHPREAFRALVPRAPLSRLVRSIAPVVKGAMVGWKAAYRELGHRFHAVVSRMMLSSPWKV